MEKIQNLILLENGVEHLGFEIEKSNPLFFRAAKEAHLILYRSMVEALRGKANLSITGIPKDKNRIIQYKIGNKPWCQTQKTSVKGCKKAWRYCKPTVIKKPAISDKSIDVSSMSDYLQSFYELLAKVQAECFMSQYFHSEPIHVTDREMNLLKWLHEEIRNEFEHFILKQYYVAIYDSIASTILCFQLSVKLLFKSGNVIPHTDMSPIKDSINNIIDRLKELQFSNSSGSSDT